MAYRLSYHNIYGNNKTKREQKTKWTDFEASNKFTDVEPAFANDQAKGA